MFDFAKQVNTIRNCVVIRKQLANSYYWNINEIYLYLSARFPICKKLTAIHRKGYDLYKLLRWGGGLIQKAGRSPRAESLQTHWVSHLSGGHPLPRRLAVSSEGL